ncbi:phenylacetate--CoA ligase family protein [Anaeromyxobacter diazotrophicus]|uniref:Coenzyme F390 synthetase n=1 Tax=Anaeromyxobacter diazotrophicus TaxID=2590199 RepID=A0A7I9VQA9_9BACT|nr:AMP-binding protein [Anaeromyxobacter diazotrophicus]GEJ58585.1 coenzyme F390 synthetase [Anaeromyxobacter diazotrophicus]
MSAPRLRPSRILDPALEQQSPAAREAYLAERLRATVAHAAAASPAFQRRLAAANLAAGDLRGPADLARLPPLRKDALPGLQAGDPPFGGLLAVAPGALARVFMSPGPIYDPEGDGADFWRFRHALAAAGFRAGEIAHNAASYHLTPLGFMLDAAARALGCAVIPAGVGQTELQVKVAAHLGATAYLGTPSFLYALLGKARELGTPLRFETAFVLAEMLPESLRAELEGEFGVRVLQGYGTADLGCLAYECPEKGGWHLHPECLVEVLDLETGQPAAPGQPGEVVATLFDPVYPLVRLGTGDLAALAPEAPCPCGRTAPKLAGLLGRLGDAVKVKGMFVRGGELAAALQKFPEVKRFQAVVTREQHQDHLAYDVELSAPAGDEPALAARIGEALREAVKVRGEVRFVPPGAIPEGAKRVDDRRVWK